MVNPAHSKETSSVSKDIKPQKSAVYSGREISVTPEDPTTEKTAEITTRYFDSRGKITSYPLKLRRSVTISDKTPATKPFSSMQKVSSKSKTVKVEKVEDIIYVKRIIAHVKNRQKLLLNGLVKNRERLLNSKKHVHKDKPELINKINKYIKVFEKEILNNLKNLMNLKDESSDSDILTIRSFIKTNAFKDFLHPLPENFQNHIQEFVDNIFLIRLECHVRNQFPLPLKKLFAYRNEQMNASQQYKKLIQRYEIYIYENILQLKEIDKIESDEIELIFTFLTQENTFSVTPPKDFNHHELLHWLCQSIVKRDDISIYDFITNRNYLKTLNKQLHNNSYVTQLEKQFFQRIQDCKNNKSPFNEADCSALKELFSDPNEVFLEKFPTPAFKNEVLAWLNNQSLPPQKGEQQSCNVS